jgi:predicted outer membrane repeat protein
MKKPLFVFHLLILLLNFNFPGHAQTIMIQGIQSGLLEADTVLIAGNVTVPAGEQLKFKAGSMVLATGHFRLDVNGSISAIGEPGSQVVFSVADTAGFSNHENGRGGWDGFHFNGNNPLEDSSVFQYCRFEYGKATGDSLGKMGGIFNIRDFGRISVSNCTFLNNYAYHWGGAIFAESGDIRISHSIFQGNVCGQEAPPYGYGGAVCFRHSRPDISYCEFTGNISTGIGGAISLEYTDAMVSKNRFRENYSGLGGAMGYLRSAPDRIVEGNLFVNNSCLFFGGAIAFIKACPLVLHNTITDNQSSSYGGAVYCNDSAVPVLINTIIHGNHAGEGAQLYIWDILSAPEFYHCNIQGGKEAFGGTGGIGYHSAYIYNIDSLPGFLNNGPHPYSLQSNSPCINKGMFDPGWINYPEKDLSGNPRISGMLPDIGAYEYQIDLGSDLQIVSADVKVSPNPFGDLLYIDLGKTYPVPVSLGIFDGRGILVHEAVIYPGAQSYRWNCSINNTIGNGRGVFILTLSLPDSQVAKVVLRN